MTLFSWITLIGVCAVGAMSPGPSLAVILQNRIQRGLSDALVASWAHAAGIFFWALAASTTLGTLFQRFPTTKIFLTLIGALFLIYLAVKSWVSQNSDYPEQSARLPQAWLTGISISLLNPKILVFFTALFSQLIPEGGSFITFLGMAAVAGLVDGTWYSFVSLVVGQFGLENGLVRHQVLINRAAACLYLIVAGITIGNVTGLLGWSI